jgi:hypothetical protein
MFDFRANLPLGLGLSDSCHLVAQELGSDHGDFDLAAADALSRLS